MGKDAQTNSRKTPAEFSPAALRGLAEARAGHGDYGSDSYMPALEALLYSIAHEAQLNAAGQREIHGRIVAALANRLTVVAWEKANPDLACAPVVAPLCILGLGRTGSSILHETLAAAPGMRTPLVWQVRDYTLVQHVRDARTDPSIQQLDAAIARRNQVVKGYAAIHYEDAHIPMECVALTILDLVSIQFATVAWVPSYRRFLARLDAGQAYSWHRRALRYLQAHTPAGQWVLKAPMHALYIDALMDTYPDAKIIQTHRDPMKVVGSMCSLYATLRRPWSDRSDVTDHGVADAAYTAEGVRNAVNYRRADPALDARICDVGFKTFMADQQGTLARIYQHFGFEFTPEVQAATAAYLRDRPRGKHGSHKYALGQFGLQPADVHAMFADYEARFGTLL